jgi:hypothetical protein
MKYEFDPKELTSEKSLWDVYVLCRRLKFSTFNKSVLGMTVACLTVYVFVFQNDIGILLAETRALASVGLNFCITVLGFLIAGFTIFATISKPAMFLKMMEVTHTETGLPHLKYNLFAFMRVFIYYITVAFLCFAVILFGGENGIASKIVNCIPNSTSIKCNIIKGAYICVGSSLIFMLLLLKTFVFNIYAIVMTHLRWESLEQDSNHQNPSDQ